MYRLSEDIKERLITEAKKYGADQLELFQAELGWEDWMNEFTEAADGEEITETESAEIDEITKEIFEEAHKELSFPELITKHTLTLSRVSLDHSIPYRTVQRWKSGERKCPHYVVSLLDYYYST